MDIRYLKTGRRQRQAATGAGPGPGPAPRPASGPGVGLGISPRCLENLWVRLKVGGRLRPRDAETLRRLALAPFDRGTVYEVDCNGYVIAVGLPGDTEAVDAAGLLAAFEARFGVPEGYHAPAWCAAG